MKTVLSTSIAALAVAILPFSANAADVYNQGSTKDAPSFVDAPRSGGWTGPYIGIHGGWADGNWNGPLRYDDHNPAWVGNLKFDDSDQKSAADGWLAGVQIGYDRQLGRIVLGVEADASYADFTGYDEFLPYPKNPGSPAWGIETELNFLATLRGRLGVLVSPDLLVYATGGLAFAQVDSNIAVLGKGYSATGEAENNHFGWTVGGGAEWKVFGNVSLKAEYLYVDLGEQDYGFVGPKSYDTDHYNADLEMHILKAGLNYRF
jgi:outer membrane immunogenic protein